MSKRPRLVGTQHIHGSRFVDRGKSCRQDAARRQCLRANRCRQSKGGGQRHRYRSENRNEHEWNDFAGWQADEKRVANHDRADGAVERGQIAHDAKDGCLLRTRRMSGANKLGGTAERRAWTGRYHLGDGFAAAHQRTGIGFAAGFGFDRQQFAGEHRLIEKRRAFQQAYVGRNDGAERQLDDIAHDQFRRGYRIPTPVAPNGSIQGETRFEGGDRCLCTAFVQKSDRRVEYQEQCNDRCFDIFAENQLKRDGGFEQARHGRQEFAREQAQRPSSLFGRRIRPKFLQSAPGLGGRKPGEPAFRQSGSSTGRDICAHQHVICVWSSQPIEASAADHLLCAAGRHSASLSLFNASHTLPRHLPGCRLASCVTGCRSRPSTCLRNGEPRKIRAAGRDEVGKVGAIAAVLDILRTIFQIMVSDHHAVASRGIGLSAAPLRRMEFMSGPIGFYSRAGNFQFFCQLAVHFAAQSSST